MQREHILHRIKRICFENPGKRAVVSSTGSISFGALWRESDILARRISETRQDNEPIIVYGSKSPAMIVSFLACAKAGHEYCPIDVSMPKNRISDIMDTIGEPLVIATEAFPINTDNLINIDHKYNLSISGCQVADINEKSWINKDDTIYIIFTSGSTGKPKGVEISADNLASFAEWSGEMFPGDMPILNQAAFSFDLSVMDLYSALTTGSTLCCTDKTMQHNIIATIDYIKTCEVGYIVSTPSFVNTLLAEPSFNSENLPNLKGFRFCGEKLTERTAEAIFRAFPDISIINTYGPTECTVAVTGVEITRDMINSEHGIPIGRPKPGCQISFDNGEIIISGDTVGKGYYRNEEKTAQGFFINDESLRSYRTGDLGYEADGLLYFSGRADSQIKLNGYRIELQDIEANLEELDEISEAVVLAKRKNDAIRYLVAIVVLSDAGDVPKSKEESFDRALKIRNALSEKLPAYMIPKIVTFIDRMPLNANCKIDRKRLEELI